MKRSAFLNIPGGKAYESCSCGKEKDASLALWPKPIGSGMLHSVAHFTKESLELLRQRVDLVEVLKDHMELKAAGSSFKGLCPFHEEKTPSFVVRRGDSHYHCFGCGAHGDAVEFLMSSLKASFPEAVEALAERFSVPLEKTAVSGQDTGPSRPKMKEALALATRVYHTLLLHTPEGHQALRYLYGRGIDLEFIRRFQLGFAPSSRNVLRSALQKLGVSETVMEGAGLLSRRDGRTREFFSERILFPIRDVSGATIGFSGRKFRESTFGGKYINTPETPLFKKSRILFGMAECRRRIAKERSVILVEGQLDALRLIHRGLTLSLAALGTAFGEGHAEEVLKLGVREVLIAFDGDLAGREAAVKAGDLFARRGISVRVALLAGGSDPDAFVQEEGLEPFLKLLQTAPDYLSFLVGHLSSAIDVTTPAGKSEVVRLARERIESWDDRVMVYESLKELARLLNMPEEMVQSRGARPTTFSKVPLAAGALSINPARVVEMDALRWLVLLGASDPTIRQLAERNLTEQHFSIKPFAEIFTAVMAFNPQDLLELGQHLSDHGQRALAGLFERRIDREKARELFPKAIEKLLERDWMQQRDQLIKRMQDSEASEAQVLELAKEFDEVKRKEPKVRWPT